MPEEVKNQPTQEEQVAQLAEQLSKIQSLFQSQGAPPPATETHAAPPAPPAPQPLSITLPNGQVITAATTEELSRQVGFIISQAEENQQRATRDREAQEAQKTGTPSWKNPTVQQKEKFAQTFIENPYEGVLHALKEITGFEDPVQVLHEIARGQQEQREAMAIQTFLVNTKDYQPSQQNLLAMDAIMKRNGWTTTPESLQAAWGLAKQYGVALVKSETQAPPAQNVPPSPFSQQPGNLPPGALATAPPAVPRGGGLSEAEANAFEQFGDLSVDQMREVLMRMSSQR